LVNGKLRLIYAHKFVGLGSSDPDYMVRHIGLRMERFGINLLMADYGMAQWEDRLRGGAMCYARKPHQSAAASPYTPGSPDTRGYGGRRRRDEARPRSVRGDPHEMGPGRGACGCKGEGSWRGGCLTHHGRSRRGGRHRWR